VRCGGPVILAGIWMVGRDLTSRPGRNSMKTARGGCPLAGLTHPAVQENGLR